jgi:hypothetical protein
VRLLFLQQCGRGSLENIYNFLNSAEYIMASPCNVGAPNTYYTRMLKYVAKSKNLSGLDIAQIIMDEDKDYTIYTLVKNSEARKLPENLNLLFNSLIKCNQLDLNESTIKSFQFEDEKNYDVKSFLDGIKERCNQEINHKINDFIGWYQNKLIVKKGIRSNKSYHNLQYSGLSLFVPSNKSQSNRYNDFPIYKETNIEEIMNLLIKSSDRK